MQRKVVSDAHIEIELNMQYVSRKDTEYFAKRLESEARDIYNFLKDHRSMDVRDVTVVREYEYRCEFCGWTESSPSVRLECCEAALREWATPEQLIELGY